MKLLNMLAVAGLFLAVPTVGSRTGEAARPNKHTRAISRATRRPVTIWERMRDPHGWWQSRFASPNPQRADSRTRPFATSARPFAGGGVANPIFFVPPTFSSGGKFAGNVAIGDFNGDGKPDLLVSNQCVSDADCSQGSVAALLGNGNGTYQPALVSNTGAVFSSLAIGDFNGDGKLDVAVSNACPDVGCASGSVNILLGNGDGSFQPPVAYASGGNAFSVEAGDVNGDGKLDVVVVNSSNSAGILLGNGDGTFKPVASFTTSASGNSAVFLGDFNGDNKLDAAVVTADCGTSACDTVVSVLPGNGDGTFQAPAGSQSFSQLNPQAVALGDVNGDGRLDLAVVEACSSPSCTLEPETVNVLLGNGNGTFGNIKSSLLLATPDVTFIGFGDFDGDSKPDLVTVAPDASATVMLGAGDGTFRFLNGYETVGASPVFGALGDLNGDGKLDLAVANGCQLTDQNTCTGAVLALLGNGNGTLQAAPDYPVPAGSNVQSVVAADFDGDGRLDLAQLATQANGASFPTASVSVLLGQADGTFAAGPSTPAGVSAIDLFNAIPMVAGDFNQDGKTDLAITGCLDQTCDNFGLIVLLGKGNGAFQSPLLLTPLPTVSLAVADLNGDGKLDLVGATNSCSSPDVCDSGSLNILLGNGDGTFQAPLTFPFTGTLTSSVSVSDLNHDGKLDVVVASSNCGEPDCPPGELSVFLGNGNGTFQTAVNYSSGDFGAYSVAIGDFNGDGKSDLAVSNAGRCTSFPCGVTSIGILLGNGDGSFQAATTFPSSSEPLPEFVGDVRAIAAADLDGDGKLDLVLSNRSVLLGNGDGTFQDAQNYNPGNNAGVAEVVADLNGDGKPDLAVTTSHFLTVLLNISAGGAQDFQVGASPLSPATISAGGSSTSTITITSMNGFNGSVSLSCSTISPSVTPAPACSFSPGSVTNGSGTATLTVSTAAPHSLSGMSASRQRPRGLGWMATGGLVMVGLLWLGAPWRRRVAGVGLMVLVFFAAGTGCGGGGGKTGGTPAGSYTITVSATSTSPQLSRTTNVTLRVQ